MRVIDQIKRMRLDILAWTARRCPIKKEKILFWSELGKRYSCNPRYLCEYLLQNHADQYDIVWMFDRDTALPKDLPDSIRVVRYFSKQWLYEIATAKYIICNHRIPDGFFFKKRKGQVYIQTWHSSLRLKTIEGDAAEFLEQDYLKIAKKDSQRIDYIISGCGFSTEIFRRAFWYDGKILECGTPRIDYLLNAQKERSDILANIGLDPDTRYVLYAPTFRSNDSVETYSVDWLRLINALQRKFGGTWRVLFRLHPNIARRVSISDLPNCCMDMTHYHDMQELLVASDLLITDYSSSMFDVAYLKKPCILYVPDLDEYVAKERKLYFDVKELPFLVVRNNDELAEQIGAYEPNRYEANVDNFLKKIQSHECGLACEHIFKSVFLE